MKTIPTHEQLSKSSALVYLSLISKEEALKMGLKQRECFEYGDRLFLGNYESAARQFAHENPTGGDFYVWLQDNRRELK